MQENHHHRHHHKDDSDIFKEQQFNSQKLRKAFGKILFAIGVIASIVVVLVVIWLYTHE